jgi:adenylyltransferase/sulfurtransferase
VVRPSPPLAPEQFERYRRHLNLAEVGLEGQQRLLEARVALIGVGGLGSPIAQYLAAAGVGTLGIVDPDVVDLSNLQRQVLYATPDVGRAKVEVARERLNAMNPDVRVETHAVQLTSVNALEILRDYQVVIDGTDNFPTRYLTNDACVLLGKPLVYGAILRFDGQAAVFDARRGPCYRCLFPEPPPPGAVPSCAEGGVLGVLPGLIALVQATEAIKLVAGIGESLVGRFLQIDALDMRFTEYRLEKDPDCPVCGKNPTVTELIDYAGFCGVQTEPGEAAPEISAAAVFTLLAGPAPPLLLDVREPEEHARASIAEAMLIPLASLEARLPELAEWKERPVVIHCKTGARSARACALLKRAGFADVSNMSGGIEAWSLTVDAGVPRY